MDDQSKPLHVAYLFPGQGSQTVGMGKDWAERYPEARQVYDIFDRQVASLLQTESRQQTLSHICFEGPAEELKRTVYTQPAILATSLVAWQLFSQHCASLKPANVVATAGHSLGEYGALVAAEVLNIETAAKLVAKRAVLMEAAPSGAMSAVLGLSEEKTNQVIAQYKQANPSGPVIAVANYNTAEQIVISGDAAAIEAVSPELKAAGAKRVLPLPVGGAFHSPLMDVAASDFKAFIDNSQPAFSFFNARLPVVTNVDATPTMKGDQCREKLSQQINHSVCWTQTMRVLVEDLGVNTVIEFGPGKVLGGMMQKSYPEVVVINIFDQPSLEAAIALFAESSASVCSV